MAKRLFEEGSEWTEVASRATNEVALLLTDVLNKLEAEVGEPVDLRDFHFVANHALGGFVADTLIRRRLGEPDAKPREILPGYPRLKFPEGNF